MESNRQAFNIDFNLSQRTAIPSSRFYFSRSQSGPAIGDPSAFVHHAMHRIGATRSFIARLTSS
jgi:hypothetical protein